MSGVPRRLEHDVLQRAETELSVLLDLIDKRLRSRGVERAALNQRTFHMVDAHRAGASLIDAGDISRVGEQIVAPGQCRGGVVVDGGGVARIGQRVTARRRGWQRGGQQGQRRGDQRGRVCAVHWSLSGRSGRCIGHVFEILDDPVVASRAFRRRRWRCWRIETYVVTGRPQI